MIKIIRLLLCFLAFTLTMTSDVMAQVQSFKIGVNSTSFFGKPEKDAAGNKLESFSPGYGFTGALITDIILDEYANDESGVRFEMTYSRQVFNWKYDGPSYQIFDTQDGKTIYATGHKKVNLELATNLVKLPVSIYYKFETGFEFALGVDLGLSIGGKGKGDMVFKGKTESGEDVPEYNTALKYNYSNDKITTVEFSNQTFRANGQDIKLPKVIGAYYETRKKEGTPFNRYYAGLNGDIAFWIQDKVALRLRASYDFVDFTSNKNSYLRQSLDADKNLIRRKSYENFLNIQLSVDVKL